MKSKSLLPVIVALMLLIPASGAKGQSALVSLAWDYSFPTGRTRDFTGEATWRSLGIDAKGFVTPRLAIGASFDWRLFDDVTEGTVEIEDGNVSGTLARRVFAIPVLLTSHYYFRSFGDRPNYLPYVGGGVGAYSIEEKLETGVYTDKRKAWNFGFCAEFGTLFPLGCFHMLLRFKYNHAFESGDVAPVSWWSAGIGIARAL